MFDLDSKIILITGGAGLLGSRFTEVILKHNGLPIILDNSKKNITSLKKKLPKISKDKSEFHNVDITNKKKVEAVINQIIKKHKKIDCLINNAATNPKSNNKKNNFENISIEQWNRELNIGLTGALIVTQAVVSKMMKQRYGNIINISSDLGIIAPNQKIYGSSKKPITYSVIKHGIIGFSKYLSTYLSDYNIRSNTLCPGAIKYKVSKSLIKNIKKLIPLNRMAKIDDYDGIILYLCSDKSSYMNGSTIICDGGRTVW
tara:strand:+ start:2814 stop:3590 length:777 start_codon:yes stop_codon:yes gene_type:complete